MDKATLRVRRGTIGWIADSRLFRAGWFLSIFGKGPGKPTTLIRFGDERYSGVEDCYRAFVKMANLLVAAGV